MSSLFRQCSSFLRRFLWGRPWRIGLETAAGARSPVSGCFGPSFYFLFWRSKNRWQSLNWLFVPTRDRAGIAGANRFQPHRPYNVPRRDQTPPDSEPEAMALIGAAVRPRFHIRPLIGAAAENVLQIVRPIMSAKSPWPAFAAGRLSVARFACWPVFLPCPNRLRPGPRPNESPPGSTGPALVPTPWRCRRAPRYWPLPRCRQLVSFRALENHVVGSAFKRQD